MSSSSQNNKEFTVKLLRKKNSLTRNDVLPFMVGYILLYSLFTASLRFPHQWLTYGTQILYSLLMFVHFFTFMAAQWSIKFRVFVGYNFVSTDRANSPSASVSAPASSSASASLSSPSDLFAFVSHTTSSTGVGDVVPVSFGVSPEALLALDPSSSDSTNFNYAKCLQFEFQKIRFYFSTSSNTFQRVQSLTNKTKALVQMTKGLHTESKINHSLYIFGDNKKKVPLPAFSVLLFSQFIAPFFIFQVFCCCLWCMDEYWMYSIFTLGMLMLLEGIVAFQRLKSLERLRSTMAPSRPVFVYRQYQWVKILSDELVVGDLLSLTDGSSASTPPNKYARYQQQQQQQQQQEVQGRAQIQVPCDMILLRGSAVLNEAMLTGESTPQLKEGVEATYPDLNSAAPLEIDLEDGSHKKNVIFGGTVLVDYKNAATPASSPSPSPPDGGCLCSVIRTGFETQQGQLLRTMAFVSKETSVNTVDTFIFILLLLCFAISSSSLVLRDGLKDDSRNRFKLLLHCIMIVTSVVPPELPMELSLAVTNSMKQLMMKSIFCTEPFRIPLGGKIDTCCFDKTGTLTSDEMVVLGVVIPNLNSNTNTNFDIVDPTSPQVPKSTVRVLAACHALATRQNNSKEVIGNPLEKAVLTAVNWELTKSSQISPIEATFSPILIHHRFSFESKLKRMSVISSDENSPQLLTLLTKGAPEVMKPLYDPNSLPADFDAVSMHHMSKGRRVLCMGWKELQAIDVASALATGRVELETNLNFAGFIVLNCPIKKDTVSVIKELKASSHECVMITGDAILTAAEVARKVNIVSSDPASTWELLVDENSGEISEWRTMNHSSEDGSAVRTMPYTHEATHESVLTNMRLKGNEFCMTGDALVAVAKLAAETAKISLHTDIDEKNILLFPAILDKLKQLVPHVSVFARHAPRQKEAVIAALNKAGRFTMMCGDGTNDVGALKQAHVGISLISVPEIEKKKRQAEAGIKKIQKAARKEEKIARKVAENGNSVVVVKGKSKSKSKSSSAANESSLKSLLKEVKDADRMIDSVELGDASVASPFTSRGTSIVCCKYVILQGRCTLVTMMQIYRILGVNCLTAALTLSKLTILGVKQGDFQMLVVGVAVACLFYLLSLAQPLETLAPIKPPSSVLTFHAFCSISSQFAVHLLSMMTVTNLALPYLNPEDPSIIPDGPFNPNVLNTATMLINFTVTCNAFLVNYRGNPFMQSLSDHKWLKRAFIGLALLLVLCITEAFPPLNQLLQLSTLEQDLRYSILVICFLDTAAVWVLEQMLVTLL